MVQPVFARWTRATTRQISERRGAAPGPRRRKGLDGPAGQSLRDRPSGVLLAALAEPFEPLPSGFSRTGDLDRILSRQWFKGGGEGGKFEPPVPLRAHLISSQAHSTTLPPLRTTVFLAKGEERRAGLPTSRIFAGETWKLLARFSRK